MMQTCIHVFMSYKIFYKDLIFYLQGFQLYFGHYRNISIDIKKKYIKFVQFFCVIFFNHENKRHKLLK